MVPSELSTWRRAGRIVRRGIGSLRWQLTLSYALVTLAAALTLSLASAAMQASGGEVSVDRAGVSRILEKDAARAGFYLSGAAPSPDAARFWLVVPTIDDLTPQARGQQVVVAIFNASGRLIVADSCTQQDYARRPADACPALAHRMVATLLASPDGRGAVAAVNRGTRGGQPITGNASGHGFVAAPVLSADKQPGGVLVAIFQGRVPVTPGQSALEVFLARWGASWPTDWFPMVLVTLILGTGIGLALSHRLIRRIRSMATIVRTWSRGDLDPSIDTRGSGELERLGADLNQMAEQIRNLLRTRAEIAMREERHRMQRDLHDGIKQELFATAMHLAAARALLPPHDTQRVPGVAASLEKAQGAARRAQHEVGALLDELPPPPLTHGDLCAAITEMVQQFEEQTGIPVALDMAAELRLVEGAEEAVVRVVQEALTNIRRHAHATNVGIKATLEEDTLHIQVEDNGHGFPVEDFPNRGLGLSIMRERVESLGGRFTIVSAETGTKIDTALPAESHEP